MDMKSPLESKYCCLEKSLRKVYKYVYFCLDKFAFYGTHIQLDAATSLMLSEKYTKSTKKQTLECYTSE